METFIKQCWERIVIGILLIAMIIPISKCSKLAEEKKLVLNSLDSSYLEARYYKNKLGQVVGQVKTQELTIAELKSIGGQLGVDNEKLKKKVGNLNRLVAHWEGVVNSSGVVDSRLEQIDPDTFGLDFDLDNSGLEFTLDSAKQKFSWSNSYLKLNGRISDDSVQIKYDYQSKFEFTPYYKKDGLFKKKYLVTDIYIEDPNVRVREVKGIVIDVPKKKLVERPIVWGLLVGIGLGLFLSR